MNKWKSRYRRWCRWKKRNTNSKIYQLLVLVGLLNSPTFEMYM